MPFFLEGGKYLGFLFIFVNEGEGGRGRGRGRGVPFYSVVGQALWFRLHVRCSFYHSIHKDNGGRGGTNPKSKNGETWKGKTITWVPSHSSNHFVLPLAFAFCAAPLLGDFGIPQLTLP